MSTISPIKRIHEDQYEKHVRELARKTLASGAAIILGIYDPANPDLRRGTVVGELHENTELLSRICYQMQKQLTPEARVDLANALRAIASAVEADRMLSIVQATPTSSQIIQ